MTPGGPARKPPMRVTGMPASRAASLQRGLAVRRDGEQQLVVVAAGQDGGQPVRAGLPRRRRQRHAARRRSPRQGRRRGRDGRGPAPAHPTHPCRRRPRRRSSGRRAAAAEDSGRCRWPVGSVSFPCATASPSAPSPIVPVTQMPSPGWAPVAPHHRSWCDMADDGQRQGHRSRRRGGIAAEQGDVEFVLVLREAGGEAREPRRPACRAAQRRSSGSRAARRPSLRGPTGSRAAACGRPGRADRRAGNARRRSLHPRSAPVRGLRAARARRRRRAGRARPVPRADGNAARSVRTRQADAESVMAFIFGSVLSGRASDV